MNLYNLHNKPEILKYKNEEMTYDFDSMRGSEIVDLLISIGIPSKKAEQKIIAEKDVNTMLYYACDVLNDRLPEAEKYILTDPKSIIIYSIHAIKGRWSEAEKQLLNSAEYYCTEENFKGKSEEYIHEHCKWVGWYANDVIKGRWPEAEKFIKMSPIVAGHYAIKAMKKRWDDKELEDKILKTNTLSTGHRYGMAFF